MFFRLGELFCGPGGLAKGALSADICNSKWKIVHAWANDYDQNTCDTYVYNICPDDAKSVICQDVHTLDIEKLGGIDALAFGAPCNDFSLVGKQKGIDGKYGPLYSYGVRALEFYKPFWFLFENVSGIKSANEGRAFEKIQAVSNIHVKPFKLSLSEFGNFGDLIWIGTKGNQGLSEMAKAVREALDSAGILYDRKGFLPHITLVRRAVGDYHKIPAPKGVMMVRRISIMKSEVKDGRRVYRSI